MTPSLCGHGCLRSATVQHADGRLLCRSCYEAEVGVSAGNPPCPTCYPRDDEPTLVRVTLVLCSLCLSGAGGQCHVPGCALWMKSAPDVPIADHCESFAPLETEL